MILISIEVLRSKIRLKKKNDTEGTRRTARMLKIRVMIYLYHFISFHIQIYDNIVNDDEFWTHYSIEKSRLCNKRGILCPSSNNNFQPTFYTRLAERHNVSSQHFPYGFIPTLTPKCTINRLPEGLNRDPLVNSSNTVSRNRLEPHPGGWVRQPSRELWSSQTINDDPAAFHRAWVSTW